MSTRYWIPLSAVAVLLAACQPADKAVADGNVSIETVPDNPVAAGDQETTPGGVAGETAATPPGVDQGTPAAADTATAAPDTDTPRN